MNKRLIGLTGGIATGKTTVSNYLGDRYGLPILDADVYGPSQHLMFDVEKARPLSVEVDGRSKMKPIESYGVKLL